MSKHKTLNFTWELNKYIIKNYLYSAKHIYFNTYLEANIFKSVVHLAKNQNLGIKYLKFQISESNKRYLSSEILGD